MLVKIVTPPQGDPKKPELLAGVGTKVIDMETGKEIKGVRSIQIRIAPNDLIVAFIEVPVGELDVTANAEIVRPE